MDDILPLIQSLRQRTAVSYNSMLSPMIVQGANPLAIMQRPHDSHPDFLHLTLLVFEAVLEVVFVALPGYIVARMGMFDVEAQKLVANLNIYIFTPCLIFTKLGSQLNAEKLYELGIIPFIFFTQILVSWLCAYLVSKAFRFSKRPANFVTAMAVFGNSNSLPISLILSLSQTISGLHWDNIPGDNDDEVGARGILYLLIFQQLGQLVRWTWGYNVLLKSKEEFEQDEAAALPPSREDPLILDVESANGDIESAQREYARQIDLLAGETPVTYQHTTPSYPASSSSSTASIDSTFQRSNGIAKSVPNTEGYESHDNLLATLPATGIAGAKSFWHKIQSIKNKGKSVIKGASIRVARATSRTGTKAFSSLPSPIQAVLRAIYRFLASFLSKVWSAMNPPLWAMLVAVLVASIPSLQELFFSQGTFINNSVTHAVNQTGQVAVPLILVVLGANLGRGTKTTNSTEDQEDAKIETRLLVASLIARMILPIIIMGPILAVVARYVPISILDDPIFIIVCFLLVGAPSALQLAQICQTKGVFMGAMSKLLFQSYVVWIFPSTMVLVMCALEVVEWANAAKNN